MEDCGKIISTFEGTYGYNNGTFDNIETNNLKVDSEYDFDAFINNEYLGGALCVTNLEKISKKTLNITFDYLGKSYTRKAKYVIPDDTDRHKCPYYYFKLKRSENLYITPGGITEL